MHKGRWYMPASSTLGRLRQNWYTFETGLVYTYTVSYGPTWIAY